LQKVTILVSLYLSVCLSAWNNLAAADQSFVKIYATSNKNK